MVGNLQESVAEGGLWDYLVPSVGSTVESEAWDTSATLEAVLITIGCRIIARLVVA